MPVQQLWHMSPQPKPDSLIHHDYLSPMREGTSLLVSAAGPVQVHPCLKDCARLEDHMTEC